MTSKISPARQDLRQNAEDAIEEILFNESDFLADEDSIRIAISAAVMSGQKWEGNEVSEASLKRIYRIVSDWKDDDAELVEVEEEEARYEDRMRYGSDDRW